MLKFVKNTLKMIRGSGIWAVPPGFAASGLAGTGETDQIPGLESEWVIRPVTHFGVKRSRRELSSMRGSSPPCRCGPVFGRCLILARYHARFNPCFTPVCPA